MDWTYSYRPPPLKQRVTGSLRVSALSSAAAILCSIVAAVFLLPYRFLPFYDETTVTTTGGSQGSIGVWDITFRPAMVLIPQLLTDLLSYMVFYLFFSTLGGKGRKKKHQSKRGEVEDGDGLYASRSNGAQGVDGKKKKRRKKRKDGTSAASPNRPKSGGIEMTNLFSTAGRTSVTLDIGDVRQDSLLSHQPLTPQQRTILRLVWVVAYLCSASIIVCSHLNVGRAAIGYPVIPALILRPLPAVLAMIASTQVLSRILPSLWARVVALGIWGFTFGFISVLPFIYRGYTSSLAQYPAAQWVVRLLVWPLIVAIFMFPFKRLAVETVAGRVGNFRRIIRFVTLVRVIATIFGRILVTGITSHTFVYIASALTAPIELLYRFLYAKRYDTLSICRKVNRHSKRHDAEYQRYSAQLTLFHMLANYIGIILSTVMVVVLFPVRHLYDVNYGTLSDRDYHKDYVPLVLTSAAMQLGVQLVTDLGWGMWRSKHVDVLNVKYFGFRKNGAAVILVSATSTLLIANIFRTYPRSDLCDSDQYIDCCFNLSPKQC